MDEKIRFVAQWSREEVSFSALCRAFGISRKTGYKWVERYEKFGPSGLEDLAPIARSHPHRVEDSVVDLIISGRKEHPSWGPKKVRAWLSERHPDVRFPVPSTVGDIFKKHGLVRPRKRRLRVPFQKNPLEPCNAPNEIWCADFKGDFQHGDRTRNYPLTVMDGHSRYLLKCEGLINQKTDLVKRQFSLAFEEFGLPRRIRTDNGAPFATTRPGGLSQLSVWWIKLGITPERIEPGHPEQNGRHERMHKTLKAETANPPKETFADQQRAFDLFRAEYNEDRPHESLGQQPPARHYALSMREYHPAVERSPEYDRDYEVRTASRAGKFTWKNQTITVGIVINSEPIGIKQTLENQWEVYYGPVLLGYLTRGEHNKIQFKPIR